MRLIAVLGLVVAVASLQSPMEVYAEEQYQLHETQNMDTNPILALGKQIQRSIGETLESHEQEFERRFSDLEKLCRKSNSVQTEFNLIPEDMESKVQVMVSHFEDQLLRFSMKAVENVEEKIVAMLDNTMTEIEDKLQPINEEITSLKNRMSMLVTQEEVADLQSKIATLTANAAAEIETEVNKLANKSDLDDHSEQLGESLLVVSSLIENLTTCEDSEAVQQVLQQMVKSDKEVGELSEFLLSDSSQNSQCNSTFETTLENLEGLMNLTKVNKVALLRFEDSLGTIQDTFVTRLEDLENITQTIVDILDTTEETTTTTTSTPRPSTEAPAPCINSKFIGSGRSLDVCNAAVRFRKCHVEFVAFHCCRSCIDAGLISSIPPNYRASRTVPVLQALKFLRPT